MYGAPGEFTILLSFRQVSIINAQLIHLKIIYICQMKENNNKQWRRDLSTKGKPKITVTNSKHMFLIMNI